MKIAVLGAGTWGSALSNVLSINKHEVMMFSIDEKVADDINKNHKNSKYGDFKLRDDVKCTLDLQEALAGAEVVLMTVPSTVSMSVAREAITHTNDKKVWINTAKGFDPETNNLVGLELQNFIEKNKKGKVFSLIGPTHAEEVIDNLYSAIAVVGDKKNRNDMEIVQKLFNHDSFRVYLQFDKISALYASSLKNVYAITSGIINGIGLGDNARAAVLSRGIVEMARFSKKLKGKTKTFLGLTGIGDLIVTATSQHSRNYRLGTAIGKAGRAKDVINSLDYTAEGYYATKFAWNIAKEHNVRMPILNTMHEILYNDLDIKSALKLMTKSSPVEDI